MDQNRQRCNSNGTRDSFGSTSSHSCSTAVKSPPSSPKQSKNTIKTASTLTPSSLQSTPTNINFTNVSETVAKTANSFTQSKSFNTKNQQQQQQKPKQHAGATATFEGMELLIVTTAELLWNPVPDSQTVVRAGFTIIEPWHPSHSSQRHVHKCKYKYTPFFRRISEKPWKKNKRSSTKYSTNESSIYHYKSYSSLYSHSYSRSHSLYRHISFNCWGNNSAAVSASSSTKSNRRRNQGQYCLRASSGNLNQIALKLTALLIMVVMIALYRLDDNDSDQPLSMPPLTSDPPRTMSGRSRRNRMNNRRSPNTSYNDRNDDDGKETMAFMSKKYSLDQQQQQLGKIEVGDVHVSFGDDNTNTNTAHSHQLEISDKGIRIRYDLNQESLATFHEMSRRAGAARKKIRAIANTDRQFVLGVVGGEKPKNSVACGSSREVLLCHKPASAFQQSDTGSTNTADAAAVFDELTKRKKESFESIKAALNAQRAEAKRLQKLEEDFQSPAKKKNTMAGTPISGDDIAEKVVNTIKNDYRQKMERKEKSHKRQQQQEQFVDPNKREGLCIAAELRHDLRGGGSASFVPKTNDYNGDYDPGPRPERTARSHYEPQRYIPPQHLGANIL